MSTSNLNPWLLFADRIGGAQFGKVNKIFKFTLVDNAKKELLARAPDIKLIDMGVGEPEERAPDNVVRRLYDEALRKENRIYPNNGTPPFKEAAARRLQDLLGLRFDPATEIVHCIGSKTALAQIPFVFMNPGDRFISTTPGYPVLPTVATWLGAKEISLRIRSENGYLPDLSELEDVVATHAPKILLLNYPNNPTGGIANHSFYEKVVALAHRYNFIIVQDAAYADLVFEGNYCSPLQVPGGREACIEAYSLSKSYNMQGYRIGYVVSSPVLLKAFAFSKDNTDNGQFIATQKAGIEALDNGAQFLKDNKQKYRRRLERVSAILNEAGIHSHPSPGSFYLYFPVPAEFHGQTFSTAQQFAEYLAKSFGIIVVPWDEAGPHIRMSMTFEVGTTYFKGEEEVYGALQERLVEKVLR